MVMPSRRDSGGTRMAVTDPRPAHHDGELSVTGDLPGTSAGEPPGGPPPATGSRRHPWRRRALIGVGALVAAAVAVLGTWPEPTSRSSSAAKPASGSPACPPRPGARLSISGSHRLHEDTVGHGTSAAVVSRSGSRSPPLAKGGGDHEQRTRVRFGPEPGDGGGAGSNARPTTSRKSAACVLAVRRMYVQGRGGGRAYLVVPLL